MGAGRNQPRHLVTHRTRSTEIMNGSLNRRCIFVLRLNPFHCILRRFATYHRGIFHVDESREKKLTKISAPTTVK